MTKKNQSKGKQHSKFIEQYLIERNKRISEKFYNGGEIDDTKTRIISSEKK